MSAAIAWLLPRASATVIADLDTFISTAIFCGIGLLLSLTSVATGLRAGIGDNAGNVLPRAFVRGTLAVMLTSVTLSLAI